MQSFNIAIVAIIAIIVVVGIKYWKKFRNTRMSSETRDTSDVTLSKNTMKMDTSILFLGIAGMAIIIAAILNRYVVEFSRIHENLFNWTFSDSVLTIGLILALSAYTVSKLRDGKQSNQA